MHQRSIALQLLQHFNLKTWTHLPNPFVSISCEVYLYSATISHVTCPPCWITSECFPKKACQDLPRHRPQNLPIKTSIFQLHLNSIHIHPLKDMYGRTYASSLHFSAKIVHHNLNTTFQGVLPRAWHITSGDLISISFTRPCPSDPLPICLPRAEIRWTTSSWHRHLCRSRIGALKWKNKQVDVNTLFTVYDVHTWHLTTWRTKFHHPSNTEFTLCTCIDYIWWFTNIDSSAKRTQKYLVEDWSITVDVVYLSNGSICGTILEPKAHSK